MNIDPATFISLCTLRLQCEGAANVSVGTGFLYDFRVQDTRLEGGSEFDYPCIITNKHVVDGATTLETALTYFPDSAGDVSRGVVPGQQTETVRIPRTRSSSRSAS